MTHCRALPEALGLAASGELVAIVGGGGKSSLLFALARDLGGSVVMTTTTRMFANQLALARAYCSVSADDEPAQRVLDAALADCRSGLLVVGEVEGEKALGVPLPLPGRLLERSGVDSVVVEADGSRMRPAKLPAEHEPMVPSDSTTVVAVAGIDALDGPLKERCHRPELVSALTGLPLDASLTPQALAQILRDPGGGLKRAPLGARFCVLLNKVESSEQRRRAREVAGHALEEPRVERVVIGALADGPGAEWEVWTRVDAQR